MKGRRTMNSNNKPRKKSVKGSKRITNVKPNIITPELAREIMGKNYLGVERARQYFAVTDEHNRRGIISSLSSFFQRHFIKGCADFSIFYRIPFSEKILRSARKSHILVAVPPISIRYMKNMYEDLLSVDDFYCAGLAGYNEPFATSNGSGGWHLIRKDVAPNSTKKTWREQERFLGANEWAPSSRIMVYTIISYYLATGECLFENSYARCSDINEDGEHLIVGNFDDQRLSVNWGVDKRKYGDFLDNAGRHPNVGMASAIESVDCKY